LVKNSGDCFCLAACEDEASVSVVISGSGTGRIRASTQIASTVGFHVLAVVSLDSCLEAIEKHNPQLLLLCDPASVSEIANLIIEGSKITRRKCLPVLVEQSDWNLSLVPQLDHVELLPIGFDAADFIKAAAGLFYRLGGVFPPLRLIMEDCELDSETLYATCGNRRTPMRLQDFILFLGFVLAPDQMASRELLAKMVWGSVLRDNLRAIDRSIVRARRLLVTIESNIQIRSVRNFGYRLVIPHRMDGKS